jgi:hypothetical protein
MIQSSRDEDTAQADVRSAFSLLQSVRAHVGGTASPISNAKPLEHRRQSLVLRIKNAPGILKNRS